MDFSTQSKTEFKRAVMETPIGRVAIEAENNAITAVFFTEEEVVAPDGKLLQEAQKQLQQYFCGERKEFDLPIRFKGTRFQEKAWQVLLQIPYGETITYGEEAKRMGQPKAARAVGGANHHNPIAIIIPCHRVVAAHGMGGYGSGLEKKEYLLSLEAKHHR